MLPAIHSSVINPPHTAFGEEDHASTLLLPDSRLKQKEKTAVFRFRNRKLKLRRSYRTGLRHLLETLGKWWQVC